MVDTKLALRAVAMLSFSAFPCLALAADHTVTYSKDVAPILQAKCQECHRAGTVAPMALGTYQETRPWAKSIRERVITRNMPPWHIDKTVGVQHFVNDRSLSEAQIDTIVRWVDAGAPMGDPKDLPAPKNWAAEDGWQLAKKFGQPDVVVRSDTFSIAADGPDAWWDPTTNIPLTEPRWVRAVELRPATTAGRRVTHHALARLFQDEPGSRENWMEGGGLLMEWAVGKQFDLYRPDTGKLLLPGAQIQWDIHLHAAGVAVEDRVELAIYLYPKDVTPKYRTRLMMFRGTQRGWGGIDLAPNSISDCVGTTVLRQPARLESFQPHMHLRGKAMSMEAILPNGTVRMISNVDRFEYQWMNNYIYADDEAPVLPAGTVIRIHAWHDNTAANKNNPDPTVRVSYGRQTLDEMAHAWVNVTNLTEEEYADWIAKHSPSSSAEPHPPTSTP